MAGRMRHSTARSSGVTLTQRHDTGPQLPAYEPLSHPLTDQAQYQLETLQRSSRHFGTLREQFRKAIQEVTSAAGSINVCLTERQENDRKKRAKRKRSEDEDEVGNGEDDLDDMREEVRNLTGKMEETIRKLIDGQTYLDTAEESLQSLARDSVSQSQRRLRRRGSDEDMDDVEPTLPGSTQVHAPSDLLSRKLHHAKVSWQGSSHRQRYVNNNDYIGFKRLVHDSQYPPEQAPPLPPRETWFTETGSPAPGITEQTSQGDGSDDDIAVMKMKISTKCPLTMLEFKDPVTSKKCPHTFEKSAITELIRRAPTRVGVSSGRGQVHSVPACGCPVPGCDQTLTLNDLAPDIVLVHKIRRIQQSRHMDYDEDEDDQNPDAVLLTSDPVDDIDSIARPELKRQSVAPKMERFTQGMPSSGRPSTRLRSTTATVVDLGGSDKSD